MVKKHTTVLIGCMSVKVTRGRRGVEKPKTFVDVIRERPLTLMNKTCTTTKTIYVHTSCSNAKISLIDNESKTKSLSRCSSK